MGGMRARSIAGRWPRRLLGGLLVAALVGPVARAGAVQPAGGVVAAEPRPFNAAVLMQAEVAGTRGSVATDGKTVVWTDEEGGLVAYALAEARETRLLDGPARRDDLAVADGVLVWTERGTGGTLIRGLRLDGGAPFTIAAGPGERNRPAVSGGTVVWRDRRGGAWDLYGYDLATGSEFPVIVGPADEGAVAISGSTIVWEDHRSGRWGLTGFDLRERREFPITAGPDDDTAPVLAGDALAFTRRRAGRTAAAIVLRDLRSGAERIVVDGHLAQRPALAGDLLVWEDWRDGQPNVYAFDRASSRAFPLTRAERARTPAIAGAVVAWIGAGEFSSRVTAVRLVKPLPSDPQDPPTVTDPNTRYFPESRHNLSGAFRYFWGLNGGLDRFGLPLTEAFEEADAQGVRRQVQYFERAKLEADPADPGRIAIARLGAELTRGRTFPTVEPFESTDSRAYFEQTRHALGGPFKDYWAENGGAVAFGLPISEEFEENGRVVQYFERARFELRPEAADPRQRVGLGQIGREALVERGWLAPQSR